MNALKQFNWDHIGIVYSTGSSWAGTFSVIRDMILKSNSTTIDPLIPLEAYPTRQAIVKELKDYCRSMFLKSSTKNVIPLL